MHVNFGYKAMICFILNHNMCSRNKNSPEEEAKCDEHRRHVSEMKKRRKYFY